MGLPLSGEHRTIGKTLGSASPWLLGMACWLAGACGEPVASGSSYDSPLFTMRGQLDMLADVQVPRVGIVWTDPAGLRDDLVPISETTQFERSGVAFEFSLFAPPPAGAIRRYAGAPGDRVAVSFAWAELPLYDDQDGDGTLRVTSRAAGSKIVAPDVYRGANSHVLVYIETPLVEQGILPELRDLLTQPPGYHLAWVICGAPDTPTVRATLDPATQLFVVVFPEGSSELPFVRTCLRTRSVAASASAP